MLAPQESLGPYAREPRVRTAEPQRLSKIAARRRTAFYAIAAISAPVCHFRLRALGYDGSACHVTQAPASPAAPALGAGRRELAGIGSCSALGAAGGCRCRFHCAPGCASACTAAPLAASAAAWPTAAMNAPAPIMQEAVPVGSSGLHTSRSIFDKYAWNSYSDAVISLRCEKAEKTERGEQT